MAVTLFSIKNKNNFKMKTIRLLYAEIYEYGRESSNFQLSFGWFDYYNKKVWPLGNMSTLSTENMDYSYTTTEVLV